MTSQEKAINVQYHFLTYKPEKKEKKSINTCTSFFCMYWYVSIFSEKYFWPQYMYCKMSPNNGFRWCPLGKLSHLGLEQLSYPTNTNSWSFLNPDSGHPPLPTCTHKRRCRQGFGRIIRGISAGIQSRDRYWYLSEFWFLLLLFP